MEPAPGVTTGCIPIQWPGERTTARHELEASGEIHNWFGGLVDDMRDATGQMYRRNRYYDPQSGQFTQPDPIGLAGGLNAYGFAAGDPVSYADPYGLCAEEDARQDSTRALTAEEDRRLRCIAETRLVPAARAGFLRELDSGNVLVGGGVAAWAWIPPDGRRPIIFAENSILRHTEIHLALTAAHEVRHKGQRQFHRQAPYELIKDQVEADAEAYALRVVADRTLIDRCER